MITSQGYNLIGALDGSSGVTNAVNRDQAGSVAAPLNPGLLPLAYNGGPVMTMALADGSPAVDAGDDAILFAPFNLTTDERGFPRKVGGHVDIGACESPWSAVGVVNLYEGPAAGSDSVMVVNAPWTASSSTNASWLHLSAANQAGTGSTNVVFAYDANPGATRTGTLTIAQQTVTVTQAGSTYAAVQPVTTLVSIPSSIRLNVAVDGAGNVFISDANNVVVDKWWAASNSVTTVVASGLNKPRGVAVDAMGNLDIADSGNNAIEQWTVGSGNSVTALVSATLNGPRGVAVDAAGNVYIADSGNNVVKEWSVASGAVTMLMSNLSGEYGVAVDKAGNVYTGTGNNVIREWLAGSGNVFTLVSANLNGPGAMAVDGSGNVYFADINNSAIKEWVAASNTVFTLVSSPNVQLPEGVAVDLAGNVYIGDDNDHAIKEVPRAFVDSTAKVEAASAGSDSLPAVLPATENLTGPFAVVSDSTNWLTVTGVTNGVVSFAFTATTTNRTGHINLLGASIPVSQAIAVQGGDVISGVGLPVITVNPSAQAVGVGGVAGFQVAAASAAPLNYQWYFNQTAIPGATQPKLTIADASASQAGLYQAAVWNANGTNWSGAAGLWIMTVRAQGAGLAGLTAYGPAGAACQVQYATSLTPPIAWMPLSMATNGCELVDPGAAGQTCRFYRLAPQ